MRRILHVDMDAFYASVEQHDHPELKGRPVIVGADPGNGAGRGVVAACSYEARAFGIHSALPISQAWKRCPKAVYLRPRFQRYSEVSRHIMTILRRYTEMVEPLSVDEAFLDVTGSAALMGDAEAIAVAIKREIRRETGLGASVGIASNKFLAKIASDLRKPDGLVLVPDDGIGRFLDGLPIRKLWGVGPKTGQRLQALGVRTIGELAALPRDRLTREFGTGGAHLWELAHGRDDRPVVVGWEPKSISSEHTFDRDTLDQYQLIRTLRRLSDQLARRLRHKGYRTGRVTLKLRYASFRTYTRQVSFAEPIHTGDAIFRLAKDLFDRFDLDEKVRLLGVGAGRLCRDADSGSQLGLFSATDPEERLARALDAVHERYGENALQRGSEL